MDMQTIVSFLNSDYKKYKGHINEYPDVQKILFSITQYIHSYGVSDFRQLLAEKGVTAVPQLVLAIDSFNYYPRTLSTKVLYNNTECYTLLTHPSVVESMEHALPHAFLKYNGKEGPLHSFTNETQEIRYYLTNGKSTTLQDLIDYGHECDECGAIYLDREADPDYEAPEYLCATCKELNTPLPYSTRVEQILGFEETKETRYGIELEFEGITARQVKKLLPHYALPKSDGTIDDGVEIVTKPACIATHKKELRALFDNLPTKAYSNTGMHVHIEKKKLSEYQIGFMLEFLNKDTLVDPLTKIAGRAYALNHYCKTDKYTTMTKGLFWEKKLMRSQTDKYTTINTSKSQTVEIRIFASPESYLECVARLEFVEGLVLYSSPYSMHVKSLKDKFKWETFEHYMKTNKHHFPNFNCLYLA